MKIADLKMENATLKRKNAALEERNVFLEGENEKLVKKTMTDPLTGIYNRNYLPEVEGQVALSSRRRGDIAMVMIDVDGLHAINSSKGGHAKGDKALIGVAGAIRSAIRISDRVLRLGGDEFLVVLPDANWKITHAVIERVRRRAKLLKPSISLSCGISVRSRGQHYSMLGMIREADLAMYVEKRNKGRR